MKLDTKVTRQLLPIFLTLLILFEMMTYVSMTPAPTAKFFQLYVLGSNQTAGNYYPKNSMYLAVGEQVNWYLGVVNNMGSAQLVAIRVKLGNTTIGAPNDTSATPSPAPLVDEFDKFMPDNETWEIPFRWSITNFTTARDGHLLTLTLMINNATYPIQNPPSCAVYSCSFSLIFELWTWNVSAADFQFGWSNGDQQRIAWLQLWFKVTSTAQTVGQ